MNDRRFLAIIGLAALPPLAGCSVTVRADPPTEKQVIVNGTNSTTTVTVNGKVIVGGNMSNIHETETRTVSAASLSAIAVSSEFGSVTLSPTTDQEVHIEAVKSVSGKRPEKELREWLQKTVVETKTEGGKLTVSLDRHLLPRDVGVGVDFTVRVPATLDIDARSQNGSVQVSGVGAAVAAVSEFGEVRVTGATGKITANSSNGAVTVEDSPKSREVNARSEFGQVTVKAAGTEIEARSNNGGVSVSEVPTATRIAAKSEFGEVSLRNVAGTIVAGSTNGAVNVHGASVNETLELHSEFGAVEADDIKASSPALKVELTARNGAVRYSGPASSLTLSSEFGEVKGELESGLKFVGGEAKSENGAVDIRIPKDLAIDLKADTNNGSIDLNGLPSGASGDGVQKSYRTSLNGGGPLLSVRSNFGGITLTSGTP